MSDLEYFIMQLCVAIILLVFIDYCDKDPQNLLIQTRAKDGRMQWAFKKSFDRLPQLHHSPGSIPYEGYLRRRLLWKKEPQQAVIEDLTSQFFERTGKTVVFVGKFTNEEMVYELLGLKIFETELTNLPVDHIICGHGSGDGRYPRQWIVGDKPTTQWLSELGIKEALVCACEWPNAVRYCGTFDGRIIRR